MPIVTEIALTFWPIKNSDLCNKKVKYSGKKKHALEKFFNKKIFFSTSILWSLLQFTGRQKKLWEREQATYILSQKIYITVSKFQLLFCDSNQHEMSKHPFVLFVFDMNNDKWLPFLLTISFASWNYVNKALGQHIRQCCWGKCFFLFMVDKLLRGRGALLSHKFKE